jgi:hypothetical protein
VNSDYEQPSPVRCVDHFVSIDHNRSICLDRDAQKPGLGRQNDGARPDRRPVGAAFLTRFLDFDQHTARPFAAECCAAPQEFISAFYRFDAEHEPLLNDDCLPNVESAQGPSYAQPVLDIRFGLRIRLDDAEGPGADDFRTKQLVGRYDPKPLLLEFVDDGREQPVIAKRPIPDAGKQFGRPPIGTQRDERRAPDTAGQDEFRHIVLAQ